MVHRLFHCHRKWRRVSNCFGNGRLVKKSYCFLPRKPPPEAIYYWTIIFFYGAIKKFDIQPIKKVCRFVVSKLCRGATFDAGSKSRFFFLVGVVVNCFSSTRTAKFECFFFLSVI